MRKALNRTLSTILLAVFTWLPALAQPQPLALRQVSRNNGFLYQPSTGDFWDPTVIYANNQYYMYTMYGGQAVWLATSADGVHWKDYGVVLKSESFSNNRVFKQFVHKAGDRYIMNYGAFSAPGSNNNLLRFFESKDLIHWTYAYELPIDPKFYQPNGRWDHMYMIPKNEANPSQGYWGYVVAVPNDHGGWGMMESADGLHFTPVKAPDIQADFRVPMLEVGGIKKIGGKYYFLAGTGDLFGFFGYSMFTFVADSAAGPFKPDMGAYRLSGTSGIDGTNMIQILSAFVKDSPEDLISAPITFRYPGTDGHGTWFLPMRKAVVDGQGHLHLGYWKQNDLAKGAEIAADPTKTVVVFPPGQRDADPIVKVAGTQDSLTLATDKPWRAYPWLESDKSRKAVAVLNQKFDLDKGVIVEGHISARSASNRSQSYAGFYVEGAEKNTGTAILLQIGEAQWRESKIGKLRTDTAFNFEVLDVTGRNSATVTGLDNGGDHTFRLWLRGGQMELYIDDLLMQSFFIFTPTGRIGLISQEAETQISQLKVYGMNL
jgi:sucrose-6-phosphate hydrolase SacC (GH32 family)